MRQIDSSNAAGGQPYYGPASLPPQQPRSEQYYWPATMPTQQMRNEQYYTPAAAAPRASQVQPQPARRAAANASKAQVRQRISNYKRRIVAVALAGFGTIVLVTGFSIHQSTSSSTSSNSSNSSNSSSSSNFFNQGGSSNVGSSSQPSSSGTTNS